jgi:hypothetical protein
MPLPGIYFDGNADLSPPHVRLRQERVANKESWVVHRLGQSAVLDELPQVALRD